MSTKGGPAFTFSLPRERLAPLSVTSLLPPAMQEQFKGATNPLIDALALLPCGWYGVEVLKMIPSIVKKLRVSRPTQRAPRSL